MIGGDAIHAFGGARQAPEDVATTNDERHLRAGGGAGKNLICKAANRIEVDAAVREKAVTCINRMLDFAAAKKANVRPSSDLAAEQTLFAGIGPA